jgi:hypothetical protein
MLGLCSIEGGVSCWNITPIHYDQDTDSYFWSSGKSTYCEQVERLYRGGANKVGKQHFTYLYSPAREQALTSRNIRSGWMKAGLFPFCPDRVLKDIQKPLAELTIPKTDDARVESSQDEILQTPATVEALKSLHGLLNRMLMRWMRGASILFRS